MSMIRSKDDYDAAYAARMEEIRRERESVTKDKAEFANPFRGLEQAERTRFDSLLKQKEAMDERLAIKEIRAKLGDAAAEEAQRRFNEKHVELSESARRALSEAGISNIGGVRVEAPPALAKPTNVNGSLSGDALYQDDNHAKLLWAKYNEQGIAEHVKSAIADALKLDGYSVDAGELKKVRMTEVEKYAYALKEKARLASEAAAAARVDVTGELQATIPVTTTGEQS
jgi:hypothetical protein